MKDEQKIFILFTILGVFCLMFSTNNSGLMFAGVALLLSGIIGTIVESMI